MALCSVCFEVVMMLRVCLLLRDGQCTYMYAVTRAHTYVQAPVVWCQLQQCTECRSVVVLVVQLCRMPGTAATQSPGLICIATRQVALWPVAHLCVCSLESWPVGKPLKV